MRIGKVYTRTGDRGDTRLVGGAATRKDDPRVEAYGTVDELNAILGLARSFHGEEGRLGELLRALQDDLFNVGADLATPEASRWEGMARVGAAEAERLEGWIDELNADLPPLREFILPGGGPVGAFLHQARTVCRRAERRLVSLLEVEPSVGEGCLVYLNRLSDLLFVLSRHAAAARGEPEFFWNNPNRRKGASSDDTP